MKRLSNRAVAAVVLSVLACGLVQALCSTQARASDFGVSPIAQRGFGDPRNSYSWSMAWFKGKLYVGTSRKTLCVENLTVDFYLPVAADYTTHPEPGVVCPRDPNKMDLRAEVWQYTPQTQQWREVYVSPLLRNPKARGLKVARDIAYRGMVVYDGRLYVGAVTADEFLPQLKRDHPPTLLNTTDGIHFHAVSARNVIVSEPFGISRPVGFRSMVVWGNKMYVTLSSGLTGDGSVFEVSRPSSARHVHFTRVSLSSMAVFEIEPYHNRLYVGTGSQTTGYGVAWTGPPRKGRYHFNTVVSNGAGRGQVVTSVVSMGVYRGQLYVGSSGWYTKNVLPTSELIRIKPDNKWQLVVGNPRVVRGVLKSPVSGLVDGFSNIFAAHFWRMTSYDGALYVGTNDWSWLLEEDQADPWLQSVLAGEFGFDIWASCNGTSWFPVTRDAFGNMDDFGARNLVGSPSGLFIGSANHAQGTTVWRDTDSVCSSLIKPRRKPTAHHRRSPTKHHRSKPTKHHRSKPTTHHRGKPTTPQALMTDVQPRGTVLSWVRSTDAVRYEVFRTDYSTSIPFSYRAPQTMPNGFIPEDSVPIPAAAGSPGSAETMLPVPGPSTLVGSSTRDHFVDRTAPRGVRVIYQVAAVGPTGTSSARSNVQMVPDPRPPATLAQLERMLPPTAAASVAAVGPNQQLAAVDQWLRGHLDPAARLLAQRLQRRLTYAGIAGGP
jgi:hypothetical protein